jgi:hypothetical protein
MEHLSFPGMGRFVNMAAFPDHSGFPWMREAGGFRRCTPEIEGERFSPDRGK